MQMRYTYLSDGTKVSALDATGKGLLYKGNFVYDKTGNTVNLESVAWDEGRIRKTVLPVSEDIGLIDIGGTIAEDGTFPGVPRPGKHLVDFFQFEDSELTAETADEVIYRTAVHITQDQWFVKDHLGNVRSVLNLSASRNASVDDVILEQNDYYPFGTRIEPAGKSQATNRYRYAGKEEQNIAGMDLSLLDFGARYYDAFVGRWNAIDPLAHKYFGMSPYNYCGNDPVNFFDPDGKRVVFDKSCSADFKTKFKAAVDFMNEKGTSGNLAQLDQSSKLYFIADGRGKRSRNQFNSNTSTISWDPDCMFISDEGIMVSSTTILCHEIDHANDYDKDPENNKKNHKPNSDEQFGTKEERRACENEQKTAEKHGEVSKGQKVRDNHNGGKYE